MRDTSACSWPSNLGGKRRMGGRSCQGRSAAEGGGRRTAFTGPAIAAKTSATQVDGRHELSRVSQNRAAVQSRTDAILNNRPLPTRFFPFSYFWICWNVTPIFLPSSVCDIPRSSRSIQTLRPTSSSTSSRRRPFLTAFLPLHTEAGLDLHRLRPKPNTEIGVAPMAEEAQRPVTASAAVPLAIDGVVGRRRRRHPSG